MNTPIDPANMQIRHLSLPAHSILDVLRKARGKHGVYVSMFESEFHTTDVSFWLVSGHIRSGQQLVGCDRHLRLYIGQFSDPDQVAGWCDHFLKSDLRHSMPSDLVRYGSGLLAILAADPSRQSRSFIDPAMGPYAILKPCSNDLRGVLSALACFPLLERRRRGSRMGNRLLYATPDVDLSELAPMPTETVYPLMNSMVVEAMRSSPFDPSERISGS